MLSVAPAARGDAVRIGAAAERALLLELDTSPKPGLVSPVDRGSHRDMDAATLRRSAVAIGPFFAALAAAGAADAPMAELRAIGRAAEAAMMAATGGVNAHRGAIFALGLLCAAAGARAAGGGAEALGAVVRARWGEAIAGDAPEAASHGTAASLRFGVGGARAEAAGGFPTVARVGLPAWRRGRRRAPDDAEAARVECLFALVEVLDDTTLLHRGGAAGLAFARGEARAFLADGGVGRADWRARATAVHGRFVARGLSPGGSADLLAATLLVATLDGEDRTVPF